MAGIVATSATTNNQGDTSADKSVSGYLTNEQITLTTDPVGSNYSWVISAPEGSTRSALTSSTSSSPLFTPDVDGYYVISCVVDSTTEYIIRVAAVSTGVVQTVGNTRYLPETNAQAPAPSSGRTMFYSSTEEAMATKDPDGTIVTFPADAALFGTDRVFVEVEDPASFTSEDTWETIYSSTNTYLGGTYWWDFLVAWQTDATNKSVSFRVMVDGVQSGSTIRRTAVDAADIQDYSSFGAATFPAGSHTIVLEAMQEGGGGVDTVDFDRYKLRTFRVSAS